MRFIPAINGAIGTTLTAVLSTVSVVLSVIAGALTVGYMWNKYQISRRELRQMDD